jgi:hypothetical protein
VNTEFNWWLLIVGLVVGAGLVWLVLLDGRRREVDITERERESEARWIGESMRAAGRRIEDADALDVLRLHEAYLAASPPDNLDEADERELAAAIREASAEAAAAPSAPAGDVSPRPGVRPGSPSSD